MLTNCQGWDWIRKIQIFSMPPQKQDQGHCFLPISSQSSLASLPTPAQILPDMCFFPLTLRSHHLHSINRGFVKIKLQVSQTHAWKLPLFCNIWHTHLPEISLLEIRAHHGFSLPLILASRWIYKWQNQINSHDKWPVWQSLKHSWLMCMLHFMPLWRIIAIMILASFWQSISQETFFGVSSVFQLSFRNRVRNTRFYLEKLTCTLLAPCDTQKLTPWPENLPLDSTWPWHLSRWKSRSDFLGLGTLCPGPQEALPK